LKRTTFGFGAFASTRMRFPCTTTLAGTPAGLTTVTNSFPFRDVGAARDADGSATPVMIARRHAPRTSPRKRPPGAMPQGRPMVPIGFSSCPKCTAAPAHSRWIPRMLHLPSAVTLCSPVEVAQSCQRAKCALVRATHPAAPRPDKWRHLHVAALGAGLAVRQLLARPGRRPRAPTSPFHARQKPPQRTRRYRLRVKAAANRVAHTPAPPPPAWV
jgi:hypothetical protein